MDMIELYLGMLLVLLLYFSAYFAARISIKVHIALACLGFGLDIWFTYIFQSQSIANVEAGSSFVGSTHGIIIITALVLFIAQMIFGAFGMRKAHIITAKYLFLPACTTSFLSGIWMGIQ